MDVVASADDLYEIEETRHLVRRMLLAMKPREARVLLLRFVEEKTLREISVEIGLSVSRTNQVVHQAEYRFIRRWEMWDFRPSPSPSPPDFVARAKRAQYFRNAELRRERLYALHTRISGLSLSGDERREIVNLVSYRYDSKAVEAWFATARMKALIQDRAARIAASNKLEAERRAYLDRMLAGRLAGEMRITRRKTRIVRIGPLNVIDFRGKCLPFRSQP